jgi:hypothetical protein
MNTLDRAEKLLRGVETDREFMRLCADLMLDANTGGLETVLEYIRQPWSPHQSDQRDAWNMLIAAALDVVQMSCAEPQKQDKCDGNHGGPVCADPECWNRDNTYADSQTLPNFVDEFPEWWDAIGSGLTAKPDHDCEEHAGRVALEAWIAGGIAAGMRS